MLRRVVVPLDLLPAFGEEERAARLEEARQYLSSCARTLGAKGIRVDTQVRIGEAPTEIVALARETEADLIAMTARGQSGLKQLRVGSVAETVLRAASIPVLLLSVTATPPGS